ncbi:hypothetical protein ACH4NF_28835 [Streptomyces sp. NPDC017248]|uniref:hypothetical protein n=1 Tax=unclassified Streptomyces TaxID=2593676 RepID=UPI0037880C46
MNHTTRIAAALAVAAAALPTGYGAAQTGGRTLAPGPQRVTVAAPADEHDPEEDVELDEHGRPCHGGLSRAAGRR